MAGHPAREQLNAAADLPLVLTSRTEQYLATVREGDVLTAAAVIELDTLARDELAAHLPRTTRRRVAGAEAGIWDPVLARLGDPEASALAAVLSNPLMVYLARTSYSDAPGAAATELLDDRSFPDAAAIEAHLLAGYLPAVYRGGAPSDRGWSADRARRWLAFIARHFAARGSYDLAWWRLRDAVGGAERGLAFGLVAGLPVGLAVGCGVDAGLGLWFGLFVGLLAALAAGLGFFGGRSFDGGGPAPARTRLRGRRYARQRDRALRAFTRVALAVGGFVAFLGFAGGSWSGRRS